MIREVAIVTAKWRDTAKAAAARLAPINRIASAFEHGDLKRALTICPAPSFIPELKHH